MEGQGWINKGKPIPNVDLVKKAYGLFKKYYNVRLIHVLAHTGKQDIHSIGNDLADRLAQSCIHLKK